VIKVPPPPASPIDTRDLRSTVERAQGIEDRPLEHLPAIPPPGPAPSLEPVREASAEPAEPAREPAAAPPPAVREPAPRAVPRIPAAEARPAFHVVKHGETLFAIADRYGLEVKDLRKWNKLRKNAIQVGQRLRLKR
jgi:membrane-bound lytic murein transglycosylase D